jgi:cytochrome c553
VLAQAVAQRAETCFACHGKDGNSETPLTPSLGGQPSFFIVAQLFLFRDNRRGKGPTPMYEVARGMTDDELRAWGEFLSRLPPPAKPTQAPDPKRYARGRAIADRHHCPVCHAPDYSGREQMPRLANQREDYLLKALRDYKSGSRIPYGRGMEEVVAVLSDEAFADVAHYLAHFRTTAKPR